MRKKSHVNRETFGKNLKKARKASGMTQDQLADLIEVKRNTISMYESGKNMPNHETVELLLIHLGITRQVLFENVTYGDVSPDLLEVSENVELYGSSKDDMLSYLESLERAKIVAPEILAKIRTYTLLLYKERADDKAELIKQHHRYEDLRSLVKEKFGLSI